MNPEQITPEKMPAQLMSNAEKIQKINAILKMAKDLGIEEARYNLISPWTRRTDKVTRKGR